LLAVIVLAVGLRLALGLVEPMSTESDGGAYLAMATNLAEGNGLVDVFGNRAYYSPGYPILLAAVFLLTGPKLGAVLAVNLMLAAVSVYMVYRVSRAAETNIQARSASKWLQSTHSLALRACIAGKLLSAARLSKRACRRLLPENPAGCPTEKAPEPSSRLARFAPLLAALAWAVYVPSMAMAKVINKENLMVPLMLALVWIALVWPTSRRRIALAALAGLLAGLLAFTGATGCAVAGVLLIVMLVYSVNWRQYAVATGTLLFTFLLVIVPWAYRNYTVLGAPVLFTNAGFNLYLCHNPAATGWYLSIGETPMAADWGRIKAEGGEVAADREAARRAFAYMREYPGRTLAMFAKKAVIFWEPPYLTSNEPESIVKHIARYVWFTEYLVLIALALAGLRTVRRTWPLYLAIALFAAIHVPFVFMLRYRLPVMALLSVCAFLTVVRNAQTQRRELGAGSWGIGDRSWELEDRRGGRKKHA